MEGGRKLNMMVFGRSNAKYGESMGGAKSIMTFLVSTCFSSYCGEIKNPNMLLKCPLFYSKTSLNIHSELSTHNIEGPHQR